MTQFYKRTPAWYSLDGLWLKEVGWCGGGLAGFNFLAIPPNWRWRGVIEGRHCSKKPILSCTRFSKCVEKQQLAHKLKYSIEIPLIVFLHSPIIERLSHDLMIMNQNAMILVLVFWCDQWSLGCFINYTLQKKKDAIPVRTPHGCI